MNKNIRNKIKSAFDTPVPTRKNEFLQGLRFPKSNYSDFVYSQILYIRKRVWIIYTAFVFGALFGLHFFPADDILTLVWIISSVLPFFVLVVITELSKSVSYQMAELEMSCKYRLYDIVLVRSGILFVSNFLFFATILMLLTTKTDYSILRLTVYIFTPFTLTCALSLAILNYLHVNENIYICAGACCFVSILNITLVNSNQVILYDKFLPLWGVIFLVLLFVTVFQIAEFIKKTEESEWNLQLID